MPLLSLCFVEGLIDGLSTVSIDYAVTRLLDIKHSKAAFKDNENLYQYHNFKIYANTYLVLVFLHLFFFNHHTSIKTTITVTTNIVITMITAMMAAKIPKTDLS